MTVSSIPGVTTINYTLTGTMGQAYTIDFYAGAGTAGPAAQFLGTVTTSLSATTQTFTAHLVEAVPLASDQAVTATATSPAGDTSIFSGSSAVSVTYSVTPTADDGTPGTLQYEINAANGDHSPNAVTVGFALPGNGPFAIAVTGTLSITRPVILDGGTQQGFLGVPIIEIQPASAAAPRGFSSPRVRMGARSRV